ncbi:methylaspartate mutase [Streptomyces sp. NBC_00212]|uniref:methylaspartate mutase n=1 Tax=Streptomyces sp. NBC_00212 TaxID=2975684 RepID=UPI00324CAD45
MDTSQSIATFEPAGTAPFRTVVARARAKGELIVQPRMGTANPRTMRQFLDKVRDLPIRAVGTITLDSYTRVGDHRAARQALDEEENLNGYPIVAHGAQITRALVEGLGGDFAVQVRHGSALPLDIFRALLDSGLDATEGGPVSYCLPYGRTPLARSVQEWARCCELLAERSPSAHLESFGGCMLGQLCPPALLVALSVLEGAFFAQHGIRDLSLSYTQQTDFQQDAAALAALRRLAGEYLGGTDWHLVLYTYMGVYPRTPHGARELLRHSATLAARSGVERLIVKTEAEGHRIPTVDDNLRALVTAAEAAADENRRPAPHVAAADDGVYDEARTLIDAVLELDGDIGRALVTAFARGYLDVPYCLHADNAQRARSFIDGDGRLQWSSTGAMPLRPAKAGRGALDADGFLRMLSHVQYTFDRADQLHPQ